MSQKTGEEDPRMKHDPVASCECRYAERERENQVREDAAPIPITHHMVRSDRLVGVTYLAVAN